MLSQFRWSILTFFAVFLLAVVIWNGSKTGESQVRPPSEPAPFNLTGRWKSDTGETIVIRHDSAGQVTARFSPIVPCWDLTRSDLFSAPLTLEGSGDEASYKLQGDVYWACTNTKKMIDDCRVQKVFQTKFKAEVSSDGNTISGASFRPGYTFEETNGRYVNCRRSSEYDGWQDFVLTRETEPTPTPTITPTPSPTVYPPTPTPTPTPTPSGFCQGVPPKTAEDVSHINRLIDKLTQGIADAEKARKPGRAAADQRTRAAELRKLRDFWERIRAEPCIPREVIELLKAVLSGTREMCGRHCETTASWVSKLYPAPQGVTKASEFLRLCNNYCPY